MRLPAWKKPRASAASRSASPARCRPPSSASPSGPRRRRVTASCWCRSARSRPAPNRAGAGVPRILRSNCVSAFDRSGAPGWYGPRQAGHTGARARIWPITGPLFRSPTVRASPMPSFKDVSDLFPIALASGSWCSKKSRRPSLHRRPQRRAFEHVDATHAAGRCHRAASIPAKTRGRRHCASCARRPISARWSASARSPSGSATIFRPRSPARPGTANTAAKSRSGTRCVSRATSARSMSPASGGGHAPGIHRLALGAGAKPSQSGGAVQAPGLRAGGGELQQAPPDRSQAVNRFRSQFEF